MALSSMPQHSALGTLENPLSLGHYPPYVLLRAVYVHKRICRHILEIRTGLVWSPYGFGSTHTRRSIFNACITFSACKLRAGYGFFTRTCDVRVPYIDVPYRKSTHCLCESFFYKSLYHLLFVHRTLEIRDPCVVRAWSVSGPC